jgi:transposase-like protein
MPQRDVLNKASWETVVEVTMRAAIREGIERVVEEELAAAFGPRYAHRSDRSGYRHGTRTRQVTTPTGATVLRVPRGRLRSLDGTTAEWQSSILPRYARRMRAVDAALLQVYLCGANTRRIRWALNPLLHEGTLAKSTISRIVQGLRAQVETWQRRSLAELDLVYLYLDGFHLKVRVGGTVSSVPVLAVLGVQRNGHKVLVHLSLRGSESTNAWAAVCEDLAERGMRAPQLCIIDGSKGLHAAVQQTWPQAAIQRCAVHKLRNLLTTAPKRLHDVLRADYHAIVLAEDGGAARRAYTAFVRKWGKTCPGAVKSLEEAEVELLTMYRYPRSQWKSLRTTNCIERLYLEFRRRVKTQGSLPGEQAVLPLLYGLVASGQIRFRKLDGWQDMATALTVPVAETEQVA